MILCLETATRVCSVALVDDGKVVDLEEDVNGQAHAEKLTVFIDVLMRRNKISYSDLDAVAVSMGPGSYTGLRIGVSTAKGLCYAAGLPLIAVDTLTAMANGFIEKNEITYNAVLCPMIDARRMEVYTAYFNENAEMMTPTHTLIVNEHSFDEFEGRKIILFGDGADKLEALFGKDNNKISVVKDFRVSAAFQAKPAQKAFNDKSFVDVAYFEPFYLKDFVPGTPKVKGLE